ncbi:hypothetical protein H6G80_21695 [Nostoc sp. FACHB-87]|uniref:hypothetical protein n=1 Tax=Nostocaceae TaxID=1162 RepID=UPI00168421A7|nr:MULTISPECIES: hypothetical protein [Nostocaceae]MBD2456680.1 hypothetical protein [Nostoc sp. FACHB-87]MBD2478066.1 hypothetical protein [Anabaena sp. FACHB-83]
MRIYLYILAGLISALIGWNIGQFFLTDIGLFKEFPELTLFPCIAISLACGMVMNEIFISNPTRPKLCFRIAKTPLLIALGLGTLLGLISGGISQILFLPQIRFPTPIIRVIGWLLIGVSVGLAEGLTWRWHSMEAGDPKRFWQRLKISVLGAITASLFAATIFEFVRTTLGGMPTEFKGIEDPLGFALLGLLLGLTFSITNSPSYLGALRAGTGFEYTGMNYEDIDPNLENINKNYPYIDKSILKFVSDNNAYEIEEGLSIQLPGNGTVRIGSADKKSHIYIPDLPLHVADLVLQKRDAVLNPNPVVFNCIEVNGQRLSSRASIRLKHNYVLTFYPDKKNVKKENKFYRFVYYNRFLDPQA